ncbi:heavy metal-binding domain-containing protein [Chloroflexota bacterium]
MWTQPLGENIMAVLKWIINDEIPEHSERTTEVREEAIKSMTENTTKQGVNTIINIDPLLT